MTTLALLTALFSRTSSSTLCFLSSRGPHVTRRSFATSPPRPPAPRGARAQMKSQNGRRARRPTRAPGRQARARAGGRAGTAGRRAGWPGALAICDTSPPVFRQPPGVVSPAIVHGSEGWSLLTRSGAQRVTTISTAKQVWLLGRLSKRHLRPSSRGTKCVRYSHPGRRAATRPARPGRLPVPVVLPTHAQIIIRAHHHLRRCTLLAPAPWLHTAPSRPRRRPSLLLTTEASPGVQIAAACTGAA